MFRFGKRQERRESAAIGLFGKAPFTGDYLVVDTQTPIDLPLREWLEMGTHRAVDSHSKQWTLLESGPSVRRAFVYRSSVRSAQGWLALGLIQPSRDSLGRRFPLVIYAAAQSPHWASSGHLLPTGMTALLDGAALAFEVTEGGGDPREHLARLDVPSSEVLAEYRHMYDQWKTSTSCSALWQLICGAEQGTEALTKVLWNVREALLPWRGREYPQTPLTIRLPVGRGGTMVTAFWLELVQKLAAWHRTPPCAFWNTSGSGALTVHVGEPEPRSLVELWVPNAGNDYLCDMTGDITLYRTASDKIAAALVNDVAVGAIANALEI